MVEHVKLRQIIAKIDFLRIFQQKENFLRNQTSGCHGNTCVGVTSNSTDPAETAILVTMETRSYDNSKKINKLKKGIFKLHPTKNNFKIS